MNEAPKGMRLHIGVYGRRNVGKSSIINAMVGQNVSIVSAIPGTTTDPVEKTMELLPLGPVVFIDTAGIDDEGYLGEMRIMRTIRTIQRTDIALLVIDPNGWGTFEERLVALFREHNIPFAVVFNKTDLAQPDQDILNFLKKQNIPCIGVSALHGIDRHCVKECLSALAPDDWFQEPRLVGDLLAAGDLAVLVVPIDLGAPKGRIILPQVQTIRDILDSDAWCIVVKERELPDALRRLHTPPQLIVCDSQVVLKVVGDAPAKVPVTTFSILMARFKGDLIGFAEATAAIGALQPGDRVLIAEACSHHPLADDIGRVKIPRWLCHYVGGKLTIDVCAGKDFPDDLSPYQLVIHCGACVANRKAMLSRQLHAQRQGVPLTNYGMAISYLQGVLERTLAPFPAALQAFRDALASKTSA